MRKCRWRKSPPRHDTCSSASVPIVVIQPWAKLFGVSSRPKPENFPCLCFALRQPACASVEVARGWLSIPTEFGMAHSTAEKLRRILKEHIEEGAPVREWIAAEMPKLAKRNDAGRSE